MEKHHYIIKKILNEVNSSEVRTKVCRLGGIIRETNERLKEYEQNYDALFELCFGNFSSIDDFEKAKKDFLENTEWRFN